MKNAVSPLMSWILLVALVISIGSIVSIWATNYFRSINPGSGLDEDIYCDSVNLRIQDACRTNINTLSINFLNKGSFDLTSLTITTETELQSSSSCAYIFQTPLGPSSTLQYLLYLEQPTIPNALLPSCPSSITNTPQLPPYVKELSIVPWVLVEGKNIPCNSKKVQVETFDANKDCLTNPPILSNILNTKTTNSVTFTWNTNKIATSALNYSEISGGPYNNVYGPPGFRTSHSVTVTGLFPGTRYYFKVNSQDTAGNTATSSQIMVRTLS